MWRAFAKGKSNRHVGMFKTAKLFWTKVERSSTRPQSHQRLRLLCLSAMGLVPVLQIYFQVIGAWAPRRQDIARTFI
jgi:hypothetical protein